MHVSLRSIEEAIRAGWCVWTADPVDQPTWSAANPASGQCASTALVVQDLLGGELLMAEVRNADGSRQGVHYWNRLAGGLEVDLTREQFRRGEVVAAPRTVERPADVTRGRLPGHYHLLAVRVARALAGECSARPVTVKGVCRGPRRRVLLCRNDRGQWELPGGRPEVGEPFPDCLRRELREETGLDVDVDNVLGARALEVVPGAWVDIVAYACAARGPIPEPLRPSAEHTAVELVDAAAVDPRELPDAYRSLLG